MPSTYTSSLRVEQIGIGEADNTWGNKLNTNFELLDSAISGAVSISTTGGSTTLTTNNALADQARAAVLVITGALVSNSTLIAPDKSKVYVVFNNTGGAFSVTLKASGAGVVIPQGSAATVFCDGTITRHISPAQLAATLDANNQKITNLATPTTGGDAVNKTYADTKAPIDSPALTGSPTAPTPAPGSPGTTIATKAYADSLSVAAGNVPVGGLAGQALVKISDTDYDMTWKYVSPDVPLMALGII